MTCRPARARTPQQQWCLSRPCATTRGAAGPAGRRDKGLATAFSGAAVVTPSSRVSLLVEARVVAWEDDREPMVLVSDKPINDIGLLQTH